ncbi:MAG: COX15/CtaA family protein [Microbacteriaceae bacterium]
MNQAPAPIGAQTSNGVRGVLARFWSWLPDHVDRRIRVLGWVSLFWQILQVGSGGAVRLTGSGLGCTTWPECTPESLVTTPEMGIHGVIEFSNRMLTVFLTIIVIVMFVLVLRLRKSRPELFWLSFWIGMSIPAQAVLGGITVLLDLNPYIVGLHFLVSMALVALTAWLLVRIYAVPGPRLPAVPGWFSLTAWILSAFVVITVIVGILTTGSGPHPGDTGTPRNGLNTDLMERLHSLPAYLTAGLTLLLVGAALGIAVGPVRRWLFALALVEIVQIGVGLLQSNIGLPGYLVGIHMVLASILVSITVGLLLNLTQPAPEAPVHSLNRRP